MTANANTQKLSDAGVSIWLDDLSRDRLESGNLAELVETRSIVGVTTNPSIFQAAISGSTAYDADVQRLAGEGKDVDEVIHVLTTDDVRNGCDLLKPVFDATSGKDGRVSIEVDPRLANETEKTIAQAKELAADVDRENALIKIPATEAGLPAITATIAEGISVNVTLIFSLDRYAAVIDAYVTGLEQAKAKGIDLSGIRSVASFFVSRFDTEIDKRLEAIGSDEALALRGKAALANAQLADKMYREHIASERFQALAAEGAHPQRALWASTGVKNPAYSDTLYVDELVGDDVVNTMPEKTLEAVADHSRFDGALVDASTYEQAEADMAALRAVGIDLDDVYRVLETEGVDKFIASWEDLRSTVAEAVSSVAAK
jgi:transaldolase